VRCRRRTFGLVAGADRRRLCDSLRLGQSATSFSKLRSRPRALRLAATLLVVHPVKSVYRQSLVFVQFPTEFLDLLTKKWMLFLLVVFD
jgi:hypothetical protein